jgi:ABC-type glycerol-3-phosphate transport system permease component
MNPIHWFLLGLLGVFLLLLIVGRRFAWTFGRVSVLLLASAVFLLPFVWLISAAFKDPDVMNVYTFLPPISEWSSRTINLKNFEVLFTPRETSQGAVRFERHIFNSLFLAATGTTLTLFFSSMGGYALAKYRFRGRNALLVFMLASMTIPGVLLLPPNYVVIYNLGWMDSYKALLVPGAVSVFGIFLFRQAIVAVPDDIIEAGRIDGCGEFRIYLTLVMPLIRPMIGAFCLVSFLGAWNSFLGPDIFLQSQDKLPLPNILNQYIGEYQRQYGVFLAGTLLAIVPPAILFFSLQREFIGGLTQGAVKG